MAVVRPLGHAAVVAGLFVVVLLVGESPADAQKKGCSYNSDSYKHGETWRPYGQQDPCFECTCKDGEFDCTTRICPPLECENAVAAMNECCPKCPALGAGEAIHIQRVDRSPGPPGPPGPPGYPGQSAYGHSSYPYYGMQNQEKAGGAWRPEGIQGGNGGAVLQLDETYRLNYHHHHHHRHCCRL